MEQGFVANELAPRIPAAKARVPARGHPQSAEEIANKAIATARQSSSKTVASGERQAESGLRSAQSKLMMPVTLEFFGGIALWVGSKLPGNFPKLKVAVSAISKSVAKATHDVNLNVKDIAQLPAKYMGEVAKVAGEAKVDHWATAASAKSATLATKGEAVGNAVSKALSGVAESGAVKAMPKFLKTVAGKMRGTSLFTGLLVAGVGAGMGAALFGARAENKEAKAALQDLIAELGGTKSGEFVKAMQASYGAKKNGTLMKAGLELASGAIEGKMWMMPGGGGMAMMGGMMAPQLCANFVPESPALGAWVAYKKVKTGELKLDREAQVDLVREMVAVMPKVAANGGKYNRLAGPIAAEIVERDMSPKAFAGLMNDDSAFTRFAGEVNRKHQAAIDAAKTGQPAAAAVKPVAAETAVHGKAEVANAPSLKIGGAEHQGTVVERQLMRA